MRPAEWQKGFAARALATTVVAMLALVTRPTTAAAKRCIGHVSEHFDVEFEATFLGTDPVRGPESVRTLDELLNSSDQGRGLLFWRKETMEFAKFYKLAKPIKPAPEVQVLADQMRLRKLKTGCGTWVSHVPILPGEYAFKEEHTDGAKVSVGIGGPRLKISADRKQVELRFTWDGQHLRAVYKVKRAHFP